MLMAGKPVDPAPYLRVPKCGHEPTSRCDTALTANRGYMILAMIQKIGVLVILGVVNDAQAQSPLGYRSAPDQPSLSKAMLDAHNVVRSLVGVPPLIWSDQLAAVAQDWANYLIATNAFGHRPNNRYGENLYAITGGTASPPEVVKMWADEARTRYPQQHLLGPVRPLHADRVATDPCRGLCNRRQFISGGVGLQLRSGGKRRRIPTILSERSNQIAV
jgi:hypothetical protein